MSDYAKVKTGRLVLKGSRQIGAKKTDSSKQPKKRKVDDEAAAFQKDITDHGGWWYAANEAQVRSGPWAIETTPHVYIQSLDDGKFTLGAPRTPGDGPAPEEILTLIRPPDASWVAFKSGYGKYLSVDLQGQLVATSEAVGTREKWDLVFQEGKLAIQASNNCFLNYEPDSHGIIHVNSRTAKPETEGGTEIIHLRTNAEPEKAVDFTPDEDKLDDVADTEMSYVKKFQNFQGSCSHLRKIPISQAPIVDVKRAKTEGTLHEMMLDRREKVKADRYCK